MPGEDKSSIKSPTDAAKEIINFICNTKTTGKIIRILVYVRVFELLT